jgi:hypothetical protein
VRECPFADGAVGVTEAAEPVGIVSEQIRVDRADANPLLLGVARERRVVVHRVPGDVEGDARAAAGEPVHERRVVDPLEHVARGTGPRVDVEARPGVAVSPGRRLDLEPAEPIEDGALAHPGRASHIRPRIANLLSFSMTSKAKSGS